MNTTPSPTTGAYPVTVFGGLLFSEHLRRSGIEIVDAKVIDDQTDLRIPRVDIMGMIELFPQVDRASSMEGHRDSLQVRDYRPGSFCELLALARRHPGLLEQVPAGFVSLEMPHIVGGEYCAHVGLEGGKRFFRVTRTVPTKAILIGVHRVDSRSRWH